MMQVIRKSPFTGKTNSMVLNVTQAQIDELDSPNRRLIQQIFPNLTSAEREFVKTGYTQEDWDQMFGGLDDDAQDVADGLRDVVYGDKKE
jgi:hypothetical protein